MAQIIRSFDEIVDQVLRSSGAAGNTSTYRTAVRAAVNDAYIDLVSLVDAQELAVNWTYPMTADTSADSDTPRILATTPADLLKVRRAEWRDASETPDAHHAIEVLDHETFLDRTQGHARAYDTGIPGLLAVRRLEGARQDLMTSSLAYEVVSDSTADDTGGATPISITVRGFTDQYRRTPRMATVALDGTTAVALGSFWWIDAIGTSAVATGTITVRQDVGDVTVAQVMPWDRSAKYAVFEFDKGLDRALTLQIEYTRRPPLMSEVGDVPFYLPAQGQELLLLGAMVKGNFYKKLSDWQGAEALWRVRRTEFMQTVRPKGQGRVRLRLGR